MFEKASEEYGKMISEGMQIEKGSFTSYALSSAILGFKDGAEFGYNKANEWHYVKDEFPISDKDKYYLVVDKWNEPMISRFYEGVWSNYSVIDNVIAWKEIVLPNIKEIE